MTKSKSLSPEGREKNTSKEEYTESKAQKHVYIL